MSKWFWRAIRWMMRQFQPAEGWAVWVLSMGMAAAPAWALVDTGWVRHSDALVSFALLAALLVRWIAMRWRRWTLVPFALLLPYPLLLMTVGHVLPPTDLWLNVLANVLVWALSGGKQGAPARAWGSFLQVLDLRAAQYNGELLYWMQGVSGGQVRSGRVALLTLLALLLYLAVWWQVWALLRRKDGLLAAMAGLFIAAWNMYWAGSGLSWVVGLMALGTLTAVAVHYVDLEHGWDERRVDFSDQLRWDFGMMAGGLALAVLLISPVVPALTSPQLYAGIWAHIARPWQRVEEETSRLFPDVSRPARSPLGYGGEPALPRSHKLGSTPRQLKEEVFTARPRGDTRLPPGYWYGRAYDVYTSRGWVQSPWQEVHLDAGEAWQGPVGNARIQAWHTLKWHRPTRDVYAVGIPLAVDRPAQALVYDHKDLVGMRLSGSTRTYVALGAINVATEGQLRGAGTAIPLWVAKHYLLLPPTVPERVKALAREITQNAVTPYDKARALESALRQYPYSLDVPLPPKNRDLVDWFLFDLRRGYCDYYASAFVVMARSVGLPTRFVIGYAQGRWDEAAGIYRVTGEDAHSWPEVYFPSYGWVPFEPTASRPVFTYRGTPGAQSARSPVEWRHTLATFRAWARSHWRTVHLWTIALWASRLFGLILLITASWWLYWLWRVPAPARAYAQLLWLGQWIGVTLQPGWTPREYVAHLDERLRQMRRASSLWERVRARAWQALAGYLVWRYAPRFTQDAP